MLKFSFPLRPAFGDSVRYHDSIAVILALVPAMLLFDRYVPITWALSSGGSG